jgi:predicted nucleotide-binding protein (sugar kinase/HSP70/actin superfamily)
MIKCSKGNVEIKGNLTLLEAETVMILRGIRNILEEEYGKEHTERSMQKIFELSTMTREEIEAETEKAVREIARKIAEHLVK